MSEQVFDSGDVVAWWDGAQLCLGVLGSEERQRFWLHPTKGKAERVKPSKLAFRVWPRRYAADDPQTAAREALHEDDRQLDARAAEVDVVDLWELATEVEGEGSTLALNTLAELALGETDAEASVATARALVADGVRFARKKDGWLARDRRAVEGILQQRAREAQREIEEQGFRERVLAALSGAGFTPSGDETERRYLEAMEATAIWGDETPETVRRIARGVVADLGLKGSDIVGSFRVLRAVGRFEHDDVNLQLEKLDGPVEFPAEVLQAADTAVEQDIERVDARDEPLISIDSERTTEVDDAMTAQAGEGGAIELSIHIADPGAWIAADDPIDREARRRGVTHYFPDGKVLMLPPVLSESKASLLPGEERPSIRFRVTLDADGAVQQASIDRCRCCNQRRMTYDEVDGALADGSAEEAVRLLHEAGRRRLDYRLARGGLHLGGMEAEVVAGKDGPRLERRDRDSPSQLLVSEAMILIGEVAARACHDAGAPAIYRWQQEPDAIPPGTRASDPVEVFRIRRAMRRAELSFDPKPHASLGLDAYIQVTSPLRRYQDLVGQRQLFAAIAGTPTPYDREAMTEIGAETDRAERGARRLERDANDYWMLRWLEQQTEPLDALVVAVEPKAIVRLEATAMELPLSAAARNTPGDRIQVEVDHANPRAGRLQLRLV